MEAGGLLQVVKELLARHADVNAPPAGNQGLTALQAAARKGHLDVVKELLNNQASIDAAPAEYGGVTAIEAV